MVSNSQESSKEAEKGCYIESKKTNEYIKIISDFKSAKSEEQKKTGEALEKEKNENKNAEKDNKEKKDIKLKLTKKQVRCSHCKDAKIIDKFKNIFEFIFTNTINMIEKNKDKMAFVGICLLCDENIYDEDLLFEHYNKHKHKLYVNMSDLTIICMDFKAN